MKKTFTTLLLIACLPLASMAQEQGSAQTSDQTQALTLIQAPAAAKDSVIEYRRSSLYSVLIKHSGLEYGNEIEQAFMSIKTPDKFNNHDLCVKAFESSAKKKLKGDKQEKINQTDIANFITTNKVPHQLVAKWFNQNPETGAFNMDLVAERGFYDASKESIIMADNSQRGRQGLADAGEDLIDRTFMLINDITFVDNGKTTAAVSSWTKMLTSVAGELTGVSAIGELGATAASAINLVDGFTVNVTSYLYRLNWDDQISSTFYQEHWYDGSEQGPNPRKEAFENCPLFNVAYVGSTVSRATNISTKTLAAKPKTEQMLKVCARAIDKSIVQLQREYDEFKVNVPISNITEDGTVEVPIGLKEGINEKSEFDVMIATKDANNKTVYEKVGKIKPIKEMIWDNRFGAMEDAQALSADSTAVDQTKMGEDAPGNVNLTCSSFKVISGANKMFPGCLVREVTIKKQ